MQLTEAGSRSPVVPVEWGSTSDFQQILSKAFLTALLLTGSTERAEMAVLHAAQGLSPDQPFEDALLRATAEMAVRSQDESCRPEQLSFPSSMFPPELCRVLQLPPFQRHCFVLRFLAGLPRDFCVAMMALTGAQFDEHLCAALLQLSSIASEK